MSKMSKKRRRKKLSKLTKTAKLPKKRIQTVCGGFSMKSKKDYDRSLNRKVISKELHE